MSQAPASTSRPPKTSKELANAAYDDFKRTAVDEAKKRAVTQRVDYDTFKNMVLTAHLKPLTAANTRDNSRQSPCWNFGIDGKVSREENGVQPELLRSTSVDVPSTSGDFYRDWRRNHPTPDDKYRYLKRCGPDTLRSVFRVEVSAEVLREMLAVLEACWLGHGGAAEEAEAAAAGEGSGGGSSGGDAALREAAFVVQVLQALTAAGRFSLSVKLLGAASKPTLERLFAGLDDAAAAAASAAAAACCPSASTETAAGSVEAAPADGATATAAGTASHSEKGEEAEGKRGLPGDGSGAGQQDSSSAAALQQLHQVCCAEALAALRRAYGVAV